MRTIPGTETKSHAARVYRPPTSVRIERGHYMLYLNCVAQGEERAGTRDEAIAAARAQARRHRHAEFTVVDKTVTPVKAERFETMPQAEVEAARQKVAAGRARRVSTRMRSTGEIVGTECAVCGTALRRADDRRAFLCRSHQWPLPADVQADLRYGKSKEEGDEAVEGHGEENQAAGDRARAAAYRAAGRSEELYELDC